MIEAEVIKIDGREWIEFSADTVRKIKKLQEPLHLNKNMVHPYRRDMLVEYPAGGDKTRLRFRMAFASEVI